MLDTDQEIDKLIDKVETEDGDDHTGQSNSNVLSFAKVWSAQNDELDELAEAEDRNQVDSWALALQKISEKEETGKAKEVSGRGVRRKATQKVNSNISDYLIIHRAWHRLHIHTSKKEVPIKL